MASPELGSGASTGSALLGFCHHPFGWSSSNTGYAGIDPDGGVTNVTFDPVPRGHTWDVAITRVTSVVEVPGSGASLVFYDGGESLRNLDEHHAARPR